MRHEINRIFDTPPGPLQVMRVDLAADVEGVPVEWFEKNLGVTFKRFTSGWAYRTPTSCNSPRWEKRNRDSQLREAPKFFPDLQQDR